MNHDETSPPQSPDGLSALFSRKLPADINPANQGSLHGQWKDHICSILRRISIRCHRISGAYVRTRPEWMTAAMDDTSKPSLGLERPPSAATDRPTDRP